MTALGLLGAGGVEVIRLGLPDAGLTACETQLTGLLKLHCDGFDACLAPWEKDSHPDHEAAGRAALRARPDAVRYPVWMWHWAEPADRQVPWQRASQVPLTVSAAAAKRAAIGAFASQLTGRPAGGSVVPPGIMAHFTRQQEVFLR
jgi:LmbE family N-acetylglucosaminyl deacetylase